MTVALVLYAAGVLIVAARADATLATRAVLALAWPLGVGAGLVTITGLVAVSLILFPRVGAAAAAALILSWWMLG